MQDRALALIAVTFGLVLAGAALRADRAGASPGACGSPPGGTQAWLCGGALDLNRAEARELVRLPGVGPRTAAAIVADRAARGPFPSVESLARVKGVGPKTVARVARLVSVEPGAPRAQ
jgi:competence protein ComEA